MVEESKTEEKFDQELENLRQRIIVKRINEVETSQKNIQKLIRPKVLHIVVSLVILLSVAYILYIFSNQMKEKTNSHQIKQKSISQPFNSEKTSLLETPYV